MEQTTLNSSDTIAAISTPYGEGGIAVIRLSGPEAFSIIDRMWKGKKLSAADSHTAHLGLLLNADGSTLDQGVTTIYRAPNSYTGENVAEISIHGSKWIQRELMQRLCGLGARPAGPGEYTQRAFMNGRLDLAQAEAVADLISASSAAAHRLAISQMSGRFSARLEDMRQQLIRFASLLELELDFSEEDVEFADRTELIALATELRDTLCRPADSYSAGKVFRDGVPVILAGAPNAGKSTLLNHLLGADKAIVSDIPGTTRDIIDDTAEINGILYRFYDTAGLHHTDDKVELIGISRAKQRLNEASAIIWLIDPSSSIDVQLEEISTNIDEITGEPHHILVLNKSDLTAEFDASAIEKYAATAGMEFHRISAADGQGIDKMMETVEAKIKSGYNPDNELIVTNARHHSALKEGADHIEAVITGLRNGLPTDLIAQDIRQALHSIGTVTGAIPPDTLLHTIFHSFCIGK